MNIPGFAAEASLYKTGQSYRGSKGVSGVGTASPIVAAQTSCIDSCWQQYGLCAGLCLLTFNPGAIAACEFGCWVKNLFCQANCPVGGGGGGTPECCPFGRTCRCGGKCVTVNGRLSCVDGVCLGPHEQCP